MNASLKCRGCRPKGVWNRDVRLGKTVYVSRCVRKKSFLDRLLGWYRQFERNVANPRGDIFSLQ